MRLPWRLLHVIQRYFPFEGGSERYFRALSERFAAAGASVQVLTTEAWDLEYFWDATRRRVEDAPGQVNGVAVRRLPVRHLPLASLSHRAIRRALAESCRAPFPGRQVLLNAGSRFGPWVSALPAALDAAGDVDLVHSANIAFESMIRDAARFALSNGVPHLVTPFLHLGEGPSSKVRRYYTMPHQLALLQSADAVMALTPIEAEALASYGIDGGKIAVVGAGIDVEAVRGGDGAAARGRLGIDGPLVLSLGAAAYDKGTVHLAEAVARLANAGTTVDLVVAGPSLGEFERFLDRLTPGERQRIHRLGFVSDADKRDLLAAADVVALPSRTESFGLVFLEAWANEKPVIGAWAGAIPAVVEYEVDGLLVPFGDVTALADTIRRLIHDDELRSRLGQAGARKVVSEAEWFERVRDVYTRVLDFDVQTSAALTWSGSNVR